MSHFNEVANEWDSEPKKKLMKVLAEKAIPKLNLSECSPVKIMDFGCGTGLFGLEFYKYASELVGIDTSSGMLSVFKEKVGSNDRIRILNEDITQTEHREIYDLIVSSMVFHHIEDPKALLDLMKKLVSPNGKIAIVDLVQEDGSFHPDPVKMGVKHFGFSEDELATWADHCQLRLDYQVINSLEKGDKEYQQFLAVFSK